MKTSKFSTKLFIAILSLSSLMVLAGTMIDMQLNSTAFMQIEESGVTTRRFDDQLWSTVREVASAERELPAAQYLGINDANISKINGEWQITRVLDEKENVVFDIKRQEDANKSLILDFQMIATSRVRVDGDDALIFDVSFLHESGKTIALFRSFGNGYEIIEARRIIEAQQYAKATPQEVISTQDAGIEKKEANLVVKEDVDLILERALNPQKSKAVLKGDSVEGGMTMRSDGSISDLTFTIAGESFSVDYLDINAGGQFTIDVDGTTVSGIATNNGRGGYRVRFATGNFAGAMLNFVTEEELAKIQETEAQQQAAREEALANNPSFNEAQESIERARKELTAPPAIQEEPIQEEYEEEEFVEGDVEEIEEDEVAEYTKTKGFNFNAEPQRSIASIIK